MNTRTAHSARNPATHFDLTRAPYCGRVGHAQAGFTLIELVISMAISLFLILGSMQLFISSRSAFGSQEHIGQLMENGRTATEIMSRAIRLSRYWGCAGIEDSSITIHLDGVPASSTSKTSHQGLHGLDNVGTDATDEITVYQIDDTSGTPLTAAVTLSTTVQVEVADTTAFTDYDYVAINDCVQADVFELTKIVGSGTKFKLPTCTSCTQEYTTSASAYKIRQTRFYIATGENGRPALWMEVNGANSELIEGVDDLQIYYGEDTNDDGTVNRYVLPQVIDAVCYADGNTECWRGVASVRISLLLSTVEDHVTRSKQQYNFNGSLVTASDNRLRREFTTVIALRNHRS